MLLIGGKWSFEPPFPSPTKLKGSGPNYSSVAHGPFIRADLLFTRAAHPKQKLTSTQQRQGTGGRPTVERLRQPIVQKQRFREHAQQEDRRGRRAY